MHLEHNGKDRLAPVGRPGSAGPVQAPPAPDAAAPPTPPQCSPASAPAGSIRPRVDCLGLEGVLGRLAPAARQGFAFAPMAPTADGLLRLAQDPPAVLLLGTGVPRALLLEIVTEVREIAPSVPIALYDGRGDPEVVLEAICLGARCCFGPAAGEEELLAGLAEAARGEPVLSRAAQTILLASLHRAFRPASGSRLTPRELAALRGVLRGDLAKETAYRLGISTRTVQTHLNSAARKLHARGSREALARLLRRGPASPDTNNDRLGV